MRVIRIMHDCADIAVENTELGVPAITTGGSCMDVLMFQVHITTCFSF